MSISAMNYCPARQHCHPRLLAEYLNFLQNHRGLAKATIHIRELHVAPFLEAIKIKNAPDDTLTISAGSIHDYVIRTTKRMNRANRKHLVSSLRSFLRFLHIGGYVDRNLAEAVPVIRIAKLDRIPQAISWESVQKMLATIDRTTHSGRREYAIVMLIATYGVRIGQVTTLKLRDIEWRDGLIRFQSSKKGNPLCFPLQPDVAEALLAYIKETRGKEPFPEVFLTLKDTPRPLGENTHLNSNFQALYKKASVDSPRKGSHAIRHAFATRLMEQGSPIKTIADMLGHKCINSTFIYTKVDIKNLRNLACDWPEVLL